MHWDLGYYLDEPLPDRSTLTRSRARYGLEVLRRAFDAIVEQCQQAGLVWGQEWTFDATPVQADASLDSLMPHCTIEAHAALQAHLAALVSDEANQDRPVCVAEGAAAAETSAAAPVTQDAHGMSPPTSCGMALLPVDLPEPVRATLTEVNGGRHDRVAEAGRQRREVHGFDRRTADFRASVTDPDATSLRLGGGGPPLGYPTVDGGTRRIVLSSMVTLAR
jgi:hypothetical protein